jgi:lysozyme
MHRGRTQIEGFESREHKAYPDPLSPRAKAIAAGLPTEGLDGAPWTIGIGHTGPEVHEGLVWTDEQIDAAYEGDLTEAMADLDNV